MLTVRCQVRKIHQEKSLDVLVDRDLKNNYDRVEVEEIIQVVILCTQYLPGHRPKMSEVVRMLEGDGLAERWEASRRIEAHKLKVPEIFSEQYSDITDDSSLLIEAIELSGPRRHAFFWRQSSWVTLCSWKCSCGKGCTRKHRLQAVDSNEELSEKHNNGGKKRMLLALDCIYRHYVLGYKYPTQQSLRARQRKQAGEEEEEEEEEKEK
ncbi:hypothetical protein BHE74_00007297 [Ensete ventricosum]|nr:hypothetical protein BHE74_00007297 [Ensete ventricosum]